MLSILFLFSLDQNLRKKSKKEMATIMHNVRDNKIKSLVSVYVCVKWK